MPETMPRQVSGFSLQRLDDDVLLYHPGLTRTLHLNDTAALIWQLCDGTRAVDAIVHALQDAFPEHGDDIAQDVPSTLQQLERDGAIEFA